MTPQETELHNAIDFLKNTKEQLALVLPSHPALLTRSNHVLNTLINGMCHMVGLPLATDTPVQEVKKEPQPVTHILGIPVETEKSRIKTSQDEQTVIPKEEDIKQLTNDVDEAMATFLERDSKDILESVEEMTIRGVARKAGMQVTAVEPEQLTLAFIDEIKAAITKMNELNQKLQKAEKNSKRGKE